MDISKKIRGDRSGVSTLLIAIVIVIIVIIIAVAAYVLLTGNNNNNNNEETLAPGTTMTYDIADNGVESGTAVQTIIGQNTTEYFASITMTAGDTTFTQYTASQKGNPDGAVKTGTKDLDTFEGTKTLEVWEYTISDWYNGPQAVTAYVDPDNGIVYMNIVVYTDPTSTTGAQITEVQTLTAYDLVWQTTYDVSDSVGDTYVYDYKVGATSFPANIVCVAGCLNDQYGIMCDFSSIIDGMKMYFLSDNPQGLPTDAVDTGKTTTLSTIDGDVTVEIWSITDSGSAFSFYCDPNSHVIYRLVVTDEGLDIPFDLTSKP